MFLTGEIAITYRKEAWLHYSDRYIILNISEVTLKIASELQNHTRKILLVCVYVLL